MGSCWLRRPRVWAVLWALVWPAAQAQGVGAAEDLVVLTQRWLDAAVQQVQTDSLTLRMQASVGALDPRLRLAPCQRVEPYLPVGARLWGRTRLGLRCTEGATRWNVFLPVTVHAYGPAWVLAVPVSAGSVLTEQDAVQEEVDWAAEPASVLASAQAWAGRIATRPLQVGQALRQGMVRAPDLFRVGAAVRVQVQGPGYAVVASGQAMSAGAAGQSVRIRMSNGKIISGIVSEDGTVDVAL